MKSIKLLILFILLTLNHLHGQEKFQLTGKTVSNRKVIENVHIVNLSNSKGTLTSDLGLFNISVQVGDTLLISSLAYNRLKINITKELQETPSISIELTPKVEQLDEMKLTGLTGDLEHDLQRKPKDTIPKIGWKFSKKDLRINLKPDELALQKSVNAENFVNPIRGGGAGIGLPNKGLIREQRLKRTLKLKKEFPDKLIKEFGISYFTVTLGIEKEEIPKFISFCEPLGLFEKYSNNELLKVIEILKTESKNYHELED